VPQTKFNALITAAENKGSPSQEYTIKWRSRDEMLLLKVTKYFTREETQLQVSAHSNALYNLEGFILCFGNTLLRSKKETLKHGNKDGNPLKCRQQYILCASQVIFIFFVPLKYLNLTLVSCSQSEISIMLDTMFSSFLFLMRASLTLQ
jgi:hypothetical protein